jgi:hypothetical protein
LDPFDPDAPVPIVISNSYSPEFVDNLEDQVTLVDALLIYNLPDCKDSDGDACSI